MLGRPSSVSRALQIIGDKWSLMVVREAFFANRRYDRIQSEVSDYQLPEPIAQKFLHENAIEAFKL